jgi:hypothetical protein
LLLSCGGGGGQTISPEIANDSGLCNGMRIDRRRERIIALEKPDLLKPYIDPAFGGKVVRISSAQYGAVIKPMYSTMQSWNADESKLVLYHTGGAMAPGHYLYDGFTYALIGQLDIVTSSIEEVFWHHSDPDIFFYVSSLFSQYGSLIKYNVRTHTEEELVNFSAVCGVDRVIKAGNNVMMQSMDDDLFGFRCGIADKDIAFVYSIKNGLSATLAIGEGTPYEPWYAPIPVPSGNHYLLGGTVLSDNLQRVEHELDLFEFHSHASIGQMSDGTDALFATAFEYSPLGCDGDVDDGLGLLVVHNLNNGKCRNVLSDSRNYSEPLSGTHVSAVAYQWPGWVAMSSIGYDRLNYLSNQRKAPLLLSEVYLANTAPDATQVCRLAHHRSTGKDAANALYAGYLGEPHATISPSGTRIMFGSDWHDSGSVDTYVIELPKYVLYSSVN